MTAPERQWSQTAVIHRKCILSRMQLSRCLAVKEAVAYRCTRHGLMKLSVISFTCDVLCPTSCSRPVLAGTTLLFVKL